MALGRLLMKLQPELAKPNALAVLSRGYGRESRELVVVEPGMNYRLCGDEPLLIKQALPNATVVVHAERTSAAQHAVGRLGAWLLLLDDGFQHRKIARDLDLVLVDGLEPLGNGRLLPAGPLREAPRALVRASMLIGVGVEVEAAARLAARLGKPFIQAVPSLTLPPELIEDPSRPLFVLTSIARPSRFTRMLLDKSLNIKGELAFRDHHRFTKDDVIAVCLAARQSGAMAVITTAKDRLRLTSWPDDLPLHVAELSLELVPDQILHETLAEWAGKAMKVNEN